MTTAPRSRPAPGPAARAAAAAAAAALAALAALLLGAGAARAAEAGVTLQGGWMRTLIAARPAAGYFTLDNATATARTLVGARSPACGALMLHESLQQGGVDRMVAVHEVAVPAHGTLRFAPGGYHLMCMRPDPAMRPGGAVAVTLVFADGGTLAAEFAVRGATAP